MRCHQVPLSCCKTTNPHRYPHAIEEIYFKNVSGCLTAPDTSNCNLRVSPTSLLVQSSSYQCDKVALAD